MILITDAHVSEANGNVTEFFEMLTAIEETDQDVVFLGDIFDLWLGLKRYEEPIHERFVAWCRGQKERRTVGFIEGNHEFFVVRRHHAAFTWCDRAGYRSADGSWLFVHGDLINREDVNYLRFRRLTKNLFVRELVRVLPWGKRLIARLKESLKTTNQSFRMHLPERAIETYAQQQFQRGVHGVFVGHFHQAFAVNGTGGQALHVLPAWLDCHQATVVNDVGATPRSGPWRKLW